MLSSIVHCIPFYAAYKNWCERKRVELLLESVKKGKELAGRRMEQYFHAEQEELDRLRAFVASHDCSTLDFYMTTARGIAKQIVRIRKFVALNAGFYTEFQTIQMILENAELSNELNRIAYPHSMGMSNDLHETAAASVDSVLNKLLQNSLDNLDDVAEDTLNSDLTDEQIERLENALGVNKPYDNSTTCA